MTQVSDIELLRQYAARNSEEAFAALVQRYIRLVYSVAFRQLGNSHQADDVTQAVFIILARKAASFPSGTPLTGWLYQTARLTTANLIRSEIRRRRHEQETFMQSQTNPSPTDPAWQGLSPLLDEAMGQLNSKERTAILIRYFEGRSFAEVAAALDSTDAAVQRRISRAVEKLRLFFAQRGVKISAAILVAAISANSLQAVPSTLSGVVTASAVAKGATAGPSTLTLIKGALKLMAWTKLKTALIVGACGLAAVTATYTVSDLLDPSIREMPDDWQVFAGSAGVWHWAHGKITAHASYGDSLLLSGKEYRDFNLSVVANASTREASLAFHMADASSGYMVIYCPAGTPWTGRNAAQFSLIKRSPDRGLPKETVLATFKGKKFASVGKKAKINISAHGGLMTVRLNGDKVLEAWDDTYPSGRIGFRTYGDPQIPSDATYSKLVIR